MFTSAEDVSTFASHNKPKISEPAKSTPLNLCFKLRFEHKN